MRMLGDSLPDYEFFIYSLQDPYPIIENDDSDYSQAGQRCCHY
jgi:hypothetical protein